MAKFLNKKEQVIDFQLTDYGKYLLSVGKMKPVYYAFFDDNILYDGEYAGITGSQNSIHERIKDNTPYIATLTHFTNIDAELLKAQDAQQTDVEAYTEGGTTTTFYFTSDLEPTMREPDAENLRFTSMIGDAALDGDTQHAPAWKIVALNGQISSSTDIDSTNNIRIPQINMELNYVKKVTEQNPTLFSDNIRSLNDTIVGFADDKMIKIEMEDVIIYAEELNTELFTENFDIEVFKIIPNGGAWNPNSEGSTGSYGDSFDRKYFETHKPQIINNIMVSNRPSLPAEGEITTGSVEYYFDMEKDNLIDRKTACKSSEIFNKSSYYVDLDFDCEDEEEDFTIIDIYGRVTESEICPT